MGVALRGTEAAMWRFGVPPPMRRVGLVLVALLAIPPPAAALLPELVAFGHVAPGGGFDAADLQAAYDVAALHAAGAKGAGVRVAVLTWGPASQSALDTYAAAQGLPSTTLVLHPPPGASTCAGPALDEWNLDVQMVHAIAPAAELHVYCAPTAKLDALLAAVARAVADDMDVLTQSWGTCEGRVPLANATAYDDAYVAAAARGIAVFSASGDGGSRECTRFALDDQRILPGWPATARHVVAVGGTRLVHDAGVWTETVWNTCAPCPDEAWSASGGGLSSLYEAPWWQPPGPRRSPDLAAVADRGTGVAVHSNGRWLTMGGTSVAAPVAAGGWALVVGTMGRVAPPSALLSAAPASSFRDVLDGHNGDHAAAVGHDLATGRGSLRVAAFLDALAALPPTPSGVAATRGPARGEIQLAFDPVPGADAYVVSRGPRPGDEVPHAVVGAPGFVDAGLPDGAVYAYRVAARAGGATGPVSLPVEGRTFAAPGAPAPPRWGLEGARIVLHWDAPDDGGLPLTYTVWRRPLDGELVPIGETAARTFEDPACVGVCGYAVDARNAVGQGPRSGEALAPGRSLPPPATGP